MELYNSLINETKALLESKSAKVWDYDAHGLWKDTGMSELVLQKDAAFELGASGKGSANYVLFTYGNRLRFIDNRGRFLYKLAFTFFVVSKSAVVTKNGNTGGCGSRVTIFPCL